MCRASSSGKAMSAAAVPRESRSALRSPPVMRSIAKTTYTGVSTRSCKRRMF